MSGRVHALVAVLLPALVVPAAAQQGVFVTAGRVLAGSPAESSWHLTVEHDLGGPLGFDGSLLMLPGERPETGDLYGAGADLTLFGAAHGLPTVLLGGAAGIGVGQQKRLWASWSAGLRMPLVILGPIRLMAEGRWRDLTITGRDGFEVGLVLGYRANRRDVGSRPESAGLWISPATADVLRANGIPEAKARLLSQVIETAIDEMGQPYVWGGTGDGSGGFDCSGLIQYAYGRHGILLPRTAEGQSTAGIAIRRDVDLLLPGDILTFSDHGDRVTHVGLYVGDGHFIHSATGGVRLSQLTEDDTEGRLWLHRWVGVRRVVE
jgi:NlpC/P60 family